MLTENLVSEGDNMFFSEGEFGHASIWKHVALKGLRKSEYLELFLPSISEVGFCLWLFLVWLGFCVSSMGM